MTDPVGRAAHLFQFEASTIAKAARTEADYHELRVTYWQSEYYIAVAKVEKTIGARIVKHPVTGGYRVQVVVDYGDPDAYSRLQEAFDKIEHHRAYAERFRVDQRIYETQNQRWFELTASDVAYFRLGGEPRDD